MPRTNDYTGQLVAGKLILGRADDAYAKSPKWLWRCLTCGHEGPPAAWCNLRGLDKKGCKSCRNCMAPKLKPIPVGTVVNNLEVIGACRKNGRHPAGNSKREVQCRCLKCGKEGWWLKSNIVTGCANCTCEQFVQQGRSRTRAGVLWTAAKCRARNQGVPFSIAHDDIVIPEFCPVLGIKLEHKEGSGFHDASPSLDKFIPALGYVPGNIQVISWRANRLKGDGTVEELEMLLKWMKEKGQSVSPDPCNNPD